MSRRRILCWLRRDLRLHDNAALAWATQQPGAEVAVLFVFDSKILGDLHDRFDRRVSFIHRSLRELDAKLRQQGSMLLARYGDPIDVVPRLASEMGAEIVVRASDYEPYARRRDSEVAARLEHLNIGFQSVVDSVVLEPEAIATGSGLPFRVFTPFSKAWLARFDLEADAIEHSVRPDQWLSSEVLMSHYQPWDLEQLGFSEADTWITAGENSGRERLQIFSDRIDEYADNRDYVHKEATSGLSVHFRFGTVSIREAFRLAVGRASGGSRKWMMELIWREFYQHVLWHFPEVETTPFQPQYRDISYPGSEEWFQAWCRGETGFPIVDAAMRCLNQTGFMHNRLRMIVASFLTKDLLVDYRKGEAYFAEKLLDFELASNNGGWQWAASTGCDAQPYFRIFNPYLQSAKFDPQGVFVRQWLPELADLASDAIHNPSSASAMELLAAGVELGKTYPHPLVDHLEQKEKAIHLLTVERRS